MESALFDTIIIGAGPAGLSAAIYAVRKSLKTLVLTKDIGGQASRSSDIENYLGFTLITGADLAAKFREDLERFEGENLQVLEGVEVTGISGTEGDFRVTTSENKNYQGKTILIASGRTPKFLGIPGEKEFLGKGVSTCATCDGPFFKDKDVVVIGGGNSALDATFSLMKVARFVTMINNSGEIRGDEILIKNVTHQPNVKILNNTEVMEILGENGVITGVKIKGNGLPVDAGIKDTLNAGGVFVEIGWIPATQFDQLTSKNEKGEIIVDEFGKTSVEGIYSAGDVNSLWGEQIIVAAGEGAKTALVIAEHIAKIPHQASSNPHEG